MKVFLISSIFCLIFVLQLSAQVLPAPSLEFVCELKVTTDKAIVVGETAHGKRQLIPITGGTFEGPKMKGTVISGGADWQIVNGDKTRSEIEAIYTIRTDDSVNIYIRNVGLSLKTKEESDKLAKGEKLDWSKMYFRATPKFEAPFGSKYDWLNNAIFICRGVPSKGYVSIQVWKVL